MSSQPSEAYVPRGPKSGFGPSTIVSRATPAGTPSGRSAEKIWARILGRLDAQDMCFDGTYIIGPTHLRRVAVNGSHSAMREPSPPQTASLVDHAADSSSSSTSRWSGR